MGHLKGPPNSNQNQTNPYLSLFFFFQILSIILCVSHKIICILIKNNYYTNHFNEINKLQKSQMFKGPNWKSRAGLRTRKKGLSADDV